MRKNKRLQNNRAMQVIVASMVTLFSMAALAETPKEIMQKAGEARKLPGSSAVVKLTKFNKSGQKTENTIEMVTKMFSGEEKRVYEFTAPADVKGTKVLTFDKEKGEDKTWIYMSAMRKTIEIQSSAKSQNFMGSEFSFADLNTPILDDYNFKLLKEEKVQGTDCYVVEMLPKNSNVKKAEGYSKKIVWVGKSDFMIRKSEFYDLKGKLLKVLTVKSVKMVAKNKYRAMESVMVNKQNGCKSVFKTVKIQANANLDDKYFKKSYLER